MADRANATNDASQKNWFTRWLHRTKAIEITYRRETATSLGTCRSDGIVKVRGVERGRCLQLLAMADVVCKRCATRRGGGEECWRVCMRVIAFVSVSPELRADGES